MTKQNISIFKNLFFERINFIKRGCDVFFSPHDSNFILLFAAFGGSVTMTQSHVVLGSLSWGDRRLRGTRRVSYLVAELHERRKMTAFAHDCFIIPFRVCLFLREICGPIVNYGQVYATNVYEGGQDGDMVQTSDLEVKEVNLARILHCTFVNIMSNDRGYNDYSAVFNQYLEILSGNQLYVDDRNAPVDGYSELILLGKTRSVAVFHDDIVDPLYTPFRRFNLIMDASMLRRQHLLLANYKDYLEGYPDGYVELTDKNWTLQLATSQFSDILEIINLPPLDDDYDE